MKLIQILNTSHAKSVPNASYDVMLLLIPLIIIFVMFSVSLCAGSFPHRGPPAVPPCLRGRGGRAGRRRAQPGPSAAGLGGPEGCPSGRREPAQPLTWYHTSPAGRGGQRRCIPLGIPGNYLGPRATTRAPPPPTIPPYPPPLERSTRPSIPREISR